MAWFLAMPVCCKLLGAAVGAVATVVVGVSVAEGTA
jgi:hypothetical protein